jgi:hypothetical protein
MERNNPVAPLPIPLSYKVLHKLKQWDECPETRGLQNVESAHFQQVRKQLFSMLNALRRSRPKFLHDPTYDPDLHNESAPRVNRFLAANHSGCYKKEWQKMGFLPSNSEESSRPRTKLGVMQIRSLAAHTTVAILADLGLPCAIFGSMACKVYGNQRIPNVRVFFCLQCLDSTFCVIKIGY